MGTMRCRAVQGGAGRCRAVLPMHGRLALRYPAQHSMGVHMTLIVTYSHPPSELKYGKSLLSVVGAVNLTLYTSGQLVKSL